MFATLSLSASNPLSFTSLPKMPLPRQRHQLRVSAAGAFTETRPRSKASTSLYEVLRVNDNASQTEIKSAYRSLAKLYHPDASPSESDGRDFIEIHNAYATLSDPAARAMYDLSLSAHLQHRVRRRSSVGFRPDGFYPTRRWETDQCW
ncbi:hypothetical protein PRUPE_6G032200 [Prunus persica]|uniref:PREDICTED: chaperone n=3 Tax=Prunus TaxID=3754 RepID=A0A5E4ESV4_PRUDU|nr:chaperone protein dnaJ 11, chloroplastic [Prunus persica]XP_034218056.1 chaperone protein dnaJ 11, chloroplastic [Prunus dulcis]ONH99478.1 hypothetical protein PRUPE_6G032200 [Prunus persica]VVA18837.1 PREDICTED: chaperone [Prunus dulcis]